MPPSHKQFFLSATATQALAELCVHMVRRHDRAFTLEQAIIQCAKDLAEEEQEATQDIWNTLIAEYENLTGKEGGPLQHEICGAIVTRAFLNRENLELLLAHLDSCEAKK